MLRRTLRKIIKGQEGQVLPIVLILLVIGGLLIVPTLNYASTSLKGHQVVESNTLEFYAADSGIEDALYWLIKGRQAEGPWEDWDEDEGNGERETYNMNARFVDVTVKQLELEGSNIYKITSTATSVDGGTTVLSTVWAINMIEGTWDPSHGQYTGDVYVDGDVDTGTWAEIIGNVTATGDIDLKNHSSITGNVSVTGDITLEPQTAITGNVCASGNITVRNDAIITGDIYVSGDNTITLEGGTQKEARIQGDIHADGNITIVARNSATVEGNIYVTGNLTIMLEQPHSGIVGDVYATGVINIPPEQLDRITGSVNSDYTGEYPLPPECPMWDVSSSAQIFTYEIM